MRNEVKKGENSHNDKNPILVYGDTNKQFEKC